LQYSVDTNNLSNKHATELLARRTRRDRIWRFALQRWRTTGRASWPTHWEWGWHEGRQISAVKSRSERAIARRLAAKPYRKT